MIKRYATIMIPKHEADNINMLLHTTPESESECFGENDSKSYTAVFDDGIEMDIKLCGVQYEEESDNLPWTEAVLFKDGCEVAHSNVEEELFGEWELEYDNVMYKVKVIIEEEFIPRQIMLKEEAISQLPAEIRYHVRNGKKLYLVTKPVNHQAVICMDKNPVNQICTVVSTYDIDVGLRTEEK